MPKEELLSSLNTKCLLLQANAKRKAFEFFTREVPVSAGQCHKKSF
jgi:hypothetical protein